MQGFYLFVGEKGSFKDEVFDMLPQLSEKQVIFNKITIKQYEFNKLLINFPDVIVIEQEIHHLLSLTQISDINQFAIFLNYEVEIVNKMAKIKKTIQDRLNCTESSIFTFFINKSQHNQFDKKNRVYYFQNLHSIDKGQIQLWFKNNTYSGLRISQLKIKENDLSNIFDDAQTRFISMLQQNQFESNLLKLLNHHQDQTITAQIDLNKKYINSLKTEFYCDLILLSVLAIKYKPYSISQNNKHYKFTNIQYCANCQIIYQRMSNGWMINQIYLFKFNQQILENYDLLNCVQCSRQLYFTLGFSIIIFQSIYILQMINSYYKKNLGIFQYQETLKNWEQEKQNEEIERKRKALALMLISCESQQKSSLFQKAYQKSEYTEQNEFIQGNVLSDKFYLIDSPNFCFDEDKDQTEALFAKYLSKNPIHFIFYCINYQRTSLMKDRVIQMLKFFPNVNKNQMGIIIFNLKTSRSEQSDQKGQSESEIINSMQGILKQVIVLGEFDNQDEIIEKIQNSVGNIDISQELSFKETIFGIQEDDSSQIQLKQQFQQIVDKIQNDSQLQEQQQLLYYQNRQQQLENKLNEMNQCHLQKLKSYEEIIQQTMQKMNEEKVIFQIEKKKIEDELYSIQQQKINHQYQKYERRQIYYQN